MFQDFSEFIQYIESLPRHDLVSQEKEALIQKIKAFIAAHDLIPQAPIVTVTGTNGKGSTVSALAEILVHHGVNVCAFTSPHLISYTERFSYNLCFVDEKTLLRLANKLSTYTDLSEWNFFFILFLIYLLLCNELPIDCVIIEVGIGGRLDPSNALDAALVILTQVALDHTNILGKTRAAIGFEKAALLREGIPFICADPNPPHTVIDKAAQLDCIVYQFNKQFGVYVHGKQWDLWLEKEMFCNMPQPMIHIVSLSCALQAARLLFPTVPYTQSLMQKHLPEIFLPARYQQLIFHGMELLIDVSHNPAAVDALAALIKLRPKKYHCAIFGGKITKDIASIIAIMNSVIDEWYLVPIDHSEGMDTETLAKIFETSAIKPHRALNVTDALQKIYAHKNKNTRIIAFGSFHIAGSTLAFIDAKL